MELEGESIAGELAATEALRMKREERERVSRETQIRVQTAVDTTYGLLRDYLRRKGPQVTFGKDFNFGPKKKKKREEDAQPPLSPRTSLSTLVDLSPAIRQRSLERQRHDSSHGDAATMSPHDMLHPISLSIPIQRPQPTQSAQRPFCRGFGTPFFNEFLAHPGESVDFTLPSLPKVHRRTEARTRHLTSDYKLSDVVESFESCQNHRILGPAGHHALTSPVERPGCYRQKLEQHLEIVFSQQGKLNDDVGKAQSLDERTRMETCELQRKPRTTRTTYPPLITL
jgi:hypothetical protein